MTLCNTVPDPTTRQQGARAKTCISAIPDDGRHAHGDGLGLVAKDLLVDTTGGGAALFRFHLLQYPSGLLQPRLPPEYSEVMMGLAVSWGLQAHQQGVLNDRDSCSGSSALHGRP